MKLEQHPILKNHITITLDNGDAFKIIAGPDSLEIREHSDKDKLLLIQPKTTNAILITSKPIN